jgi:hypothetical protein
MADEALRALLGRYAQANSCFTLVADMAESEVLDRFGATPVPDQDDVDGREPLIGVKRVGRWALVLEPNSTQGADSEVLSAVSRGTVAVSVHRALDSHVRLSLVEDGVVVTSLATMSPMSREGVEPDRLLPVLREFGLAGEPGEIPAGGDVCAALAVVQQACDVSFSAQWWQGPFMVGELFGSRPPRRDLRDGLAESG